MFSRVQALRRCVALSRGYAKKVEPPISPPKPPQEEQTEPEIIEWSAERTATSPLPQLAQVARTASTPLAVRLRRRKQFGAVAEGQTDATPDGLTPTEYARYTRHKAMGQLETPEGKTPTPLEWLQALDQRRTRVRGFRQRVRQGSKTAEAVGQRVYLPNIVMRLVRNHTPPGQPYNPYEATFRIPQSVTKTDVRSFLLAVYGVEVTYVRTDNYISSWYRTANGPERRAYKTYKRAVVGLVDPFYYPHRLEDMAAKERAEREEWIEKHFGIQRNHNMRKEELLRLTKGQGRMSWKFKAPFATKRSHIIRLVAERRAARESLVGEFKEELRSLKSSKQKIVYKNVKEAVKARHSIPPPKETAITVSTP